MSDWFHKGLRIHLAEYYNGKAAVYDLLGKYPHFLESYHYIHKGQRIVNDIRENQGILPTHKIFLDSGAFSMFTQGIEIDMPAYVKFVKDNADIIDVCSVLDSITDPAITLINQKKLEDMGIEPLPCFHYGEPLHYLENYLENYEHITLGGMVPIATPPLRKWLDYIWEHFLTDDKGWPTHKVHGFGLTAISLMQRYPWFSVDSTSWVLTGRFGSIFFPTANRPDGTLVISDQSPARKDADRHYDTLSDIDRASIDKRLNDWGFTAEELRSIYWKRDMWNVAFFKTLTDVEVKPFIHEEHGLFDSF